MRSAYRDAPPAPIVIDEADLVRALSAFDQEAWDSLFQREFPLVYRFVFVRTGDASAAEDIAAEVFEEASKRIKSYVYRGVPIRAWIYRIARNLTADHLSRRRQRPQLRLEEVDATTHGDLNRMESLTDIGRAMRELTKEQQEVIALRFVMGCDLAETADAIGKSTGAVKLLQHRALKALRVLLTRNGERYR